MAHRQALTGHHRAAPVAELLVSQVVLGRRGPEPERLDDVAVVGVLGVLIGLPCLRDDDGDHAFGVIEHPALRASQDCRAPVEVERKPAGLGGPPAVGHLLDASGVERRHGRDDRAGGRILDRQIHSVAEFDGLDHRRLLRAVASIGRHGLDRVDGVHALGHLAEDRVLPIEPRRCIGGDDEEL